MATKKKLLQAAAGSAGGAVIPSVENTFSNYLYGGSGTITNNVNLSGDGGMVILKNRGTSSNWSIHDTERTASHQVSFNTTGGNETLYGDLSSFNNDGFTIGTSGGGNNTGTAVASWSFKKHEKFFDVVKYTGNGTANHVISHGINGTVGQIWIKNLTRASQWVVWHRSATYDGAMSTDAFNAIYINNVTTTTFNITGTPTESNKSGDEYIAYIFAHNNNDGIFGPDEDQDIIKCGGFTGSGNTDKTISLGFEPQTIFLKNVDNGFNWSVWDTMRGIGTDIAYGGIWLIPNDAGGENSDSDPIMKVTQDGFIITGNQGFVNQSGNDFIYMAIRRGPMLVPEEVDKVFAMDTFGGTSPTPPTFNSDFPVDYAIRYFTGTDSAYSQARLTATTFLQTSSTSGEVSSTARKFDYSNGYLSSTGTNTGSISPMWQRAPNYFDVVCYNGNSVSGRQISHSLGVVPEMMWVKRREGTYNWLVYHKQTGNNKALLLESDGTGYTGTGWWNNTTPSSTVFTVGNDGGSNTTGRRYIAHLFASLDGISKVGSYTGTGANGNNIDCGFSNGAQFVIIKNVSGTGDWYVFDTTRGIVAGNESRLTLNTTASETTGDYIDPYSQGFSLTSDSSVNTSGATFIFYAVAAP